NSEKKIWMSYRNNPSKDYYIYYQVAGGGLEPYESFVDYCEIMFKTVIYLTIIDEIPQLTEPDRNSAWEAYTINEFKNLKVTDSLRLKESVIIETINSKFRNHRKLEDFGLLAFDVKVNYGDNGIDIIITYKQKLILVQCKNTEMPIPVQIVRVFESAISRFASDSLGIIMYNSEKLKEKGKFATLKAKQ
ncbi:1207_t:CDS:2, partial [Cetraspora pellucida]